MKCLRSILVFILLISLTSLYGQTEVELRSDGIVVPRTTPTAVTAPVKGMLIYDTDTDAFQYYNGTAWQTIGGGTSGSVSWADIVNKPAGFADNTDNVNDADASTSNEIQTLSKSGTIVTLSRNGGSFTDAVNDADANTTNEIQNLSIKNGIISLSKSTPTIPVSSISPWTIDGANAEKPTGKIGIGEPNPNARLDIRSDAGEDGLRVRIDGSTKMRVRENGGVNIGGNPSSVPANGLRVYGNTSIGTTASPTEQLEVTGAINLSGDASSNNPDAGTIRWNDATVDFEGYDGTDWKSLTGLPAPPPPPSYEIGDYEDEGVVFFVSPDGKTVKFVHIEQLETRKWSNPSGIDVDGAENNLNGYQNSLDISMDIDIIESQAEKCLDLIAGGKDDWYMPAINELSALYDVKDIVNPVLLANLGDLVFESDLVFDFIWSSTQTSSTTVYVKSSSGNSFEGSKGNTQHELRAIRTITLP